MALVHDPIGGRAESGQGRIYSGSRDSAEFQAARAGALRPNRGARVSDSTWAISVSTDCPALSVRRAFRICAAWCKTPLLGWPADVRFTPQDVSVAICTYGRQDDVRNCLEHLRRQTVQPLEILVVDASPDRKTSEVCKSFPNVRYTRNDAGLGTLPLSRVIALRETTGSVIAFLDDDAFAEPNWLESICSAFLEDVGGVTGRSRNGRPGEELDRGEVGQLRGGQVIGNFATAQVAACDVDHVIGCNMAFRRRALEDAGGIPDWHAGVSAVGEDLFLSLKVRKAGWRLRFEPTAVVLHVGSPQAKGKRFDMRYRYVSARNYMYVFGTHFGPLGREPWEFAASTIRTRLRSAVAALLTAAVQTAGLTVGLLKAMKARRGAD